MYPALAILPFLNDFQKQHDFIIVILVKHHKSIYGNLFFCEQRKQRKFITSLSRELFKLSVILPALDAELNHKKFCSTSYIKVFLGK